MTPERIEQERKAFEAWMVERCPTNPQTERVGALVHSTNGKDGKPKPRNPADNRQKTSFD